MYQKDFILRMLEMMGDLIAGILGLIKNGKIEQAETALENAYYDYLKEDAAFFRNLPIEKISESLIEKHNYTNGHLEILAGLFFTDAELQFSKGLIENSKEAYQKALVLYEFVFQANKTFSLDTESRISHIKNQLKNIG
jgi:hypothetical protein